MEKIKRIKVVTSNGDRYLVFRPVLDNHNEISCLSVCPYGPKICGSLRDPRDPENPDKTFLDFCGNLGIIDDEENKDYKDYVPVEGTIEQVFPEYEDVYQNIIKENGYVRMTNVIDAVCDGVCGLYNDCHSACSPSNGSCMLHSLLKSCHYNPNIEAELAAKHEAEDQKECDEEEDCNGVGCNTCAP